MIKDCTANSAEGPKPSSFIEIAKAYSSKNVQKWPSVNLEKWLKQVKDFENHWIEFKVNGLLRSLIINILTCRN